jgi:hypothetical protein
VTIVDSNHDLIATIASGESFPRTPPKGAPYSFSWYGRTKSGAPAPDGVYYPWVYSNHARRTFRLPNRIVLDTKAPQVKSAKGGKPVLLAGPGRSVAIRYAFSEPAHAVVYLGSRQLVVGRRTRPEGKIKWAGTVDGTAVKAGTYTLSIGAQDVAGNETPAASRKDVTVVVRYITVAPQRVRVRAGGHLTVHVETAARRYTWRIGRRHGAHRGKTLRLRVPTTPGSYRLVVSEDGHPATTLVRVHG